MTSSYVLFLNDDVVTNKMKEELSDKLAFQIVSIT